MANQFYNMSRDELRRLAALHKPTLDSIRQTISNPENYNLEALQKLLNGDENPALRAGVEPAYEKVERDRRAEVSTPHSVHVSAEESNQQQIHEQKSQEHQSGNPWEEIEEAPATTAADSAQEQERVSWADLIKQKKFGGTNTPVFNPADVEDIPKELFDTYTFSDQADNSVAHLSVKPMLPALGSDDSASDAKPRVLIYWNALPVPAGTHVLYRVVSSDYEAPKSPDSAEQLVVTRGLAFEEEVDLSRGMRHYMVWAYAAQEIQDLVSVQPTFIGEAAVVFPPQNFDLSEEEGRVEGRWTALPGHQRFRVYARGLPARTKIQDPDNEIDDVQGNSFFKFQATPGKTYEFQVVPEVQFRGSTILGEPTEVQTVQTTAECSKIELEYAVREPDENGEKITVGWRAPSNGRVVVYFNSEAPDPEFLTRPVEEHWLKQEIEGQDARYVEDDSPEGEMVTMSKEWPKDWAQVYCIPVNYVGEMGMVGSHKLLQRVGDLTDYRLVERISSQLITFDWPVGADFVQIERSNGTSQQLQEEDYRRQGGVRLELNPSGEELTLIPKSIYAGQYTESQPVFIHYGGYHAYSYNIGRINEGLILVIWSKDREDRNPPTFTLVHNRERLPLYPGDGEAVRCQEIIGSQKGNTGPILTPNFLNSSFDNAKQQAHGWRIDADPSELGYFRLFLQGNKDTNSGMKKIVLEEQFIGYLPAHGGN